MTQFDAPPRSSKMKYEARRDFIKFKSYYLEMLEISYVMNLNGILCITFKCISLRVTVFYYGMHESFTIIDRR